MLQLQAASVPTQPFIWILGAPNLSPYTCVASTYHCHSPVPQTLSDLKHFR